jgi:hypothetical protein
MKEHTTLSHMASNSVHGGLGMSINNSKTPYTGLADNWIIAFTW